MLTRCPECGTRFRVHQEQLEIAGGHVRCSRCQNVFDARPPGNASDEQPARSEPETEPTPPPSDPLSTPDTPRTWATALWGLGMTVLVLVLGLQTVWWDRHALAAHPDGLRLVQWLCRFTPCQLQPPKALEQILVPERTLEPHPERSDAMRFNLRMINQSDRSQPYPILELSLLDRLGRLAGIRRFAPDQYLPPDAANLMLPDMPTEISLDLAAPEGHVIGFQIDFL